MTWQQRFIAVSIGLLMAIGFFGLNEKFRMEAKNAPVSTIGRSGDFKSPGESVGDHVSSSSSFSRQPVVIQPCR